MKPPRGANGNKIRDGNNPGGQIHSKLQQSQERGDSEKVEYINAGSFRTVDITEHLLRVPANKRGRCYKKYKKIYKTKYVESNCSIVRNTNYSVCEGMEQRLRRSE